MLGLIPRASDDPARSEAETSTPGIHRGSTVYVMCSLRISTFMGGYQIRVRLVFFFWFFFSLSTASYTIQKF